MRRQRSAAASSGIALHPSCLLLAVRYPSINGAAGTAGWHRTAGTAGVAAGQGVPQIPDPDPCVRGEALASHANPPSPHTAKPVVCMQPPVLHGWGRPCPT